MERSGQGSRPNIITPACSVCNATDCSQGGKVSVPSRVYFLLSTTPSSTSSIEILERFQSKAVRMIVDAAWYVPNTVIRRDLQIPTVKEEIHRYSRYSACLSTHPNDLIVNLIELPDNRRLRRHLPNDLSTRFLVKLFYL
jgi:hypothetical protein